MLSVGAAASVVILSLIHIFYNLVIDPYVILNSSGDCVTPTLDALNTYFGLETDDVRKVLEDVYKRQTSGFYL